MAHRGKRLVIVESDQHVIRDIRALFEKTGYNGRSVQDVASAEGMVETFEPDLITIEVQLAKAIPFIRQLRTWFTGPVVAISTARDEKTICAAFDAGIDDFVGKPYYGTVLESRVAAILRRMTKPSIEKKITSLRFGYLAIYPLQNRVTVDDAEVLLSPIEFRLLMALANRADETALHVDLLTEVWGREYRDEMEYLRVYIRYLRQKLEREPSKPTLIRNIAGVGYQLLTPITAKEPVSA